MSQTVYSYEQAYQTTLQYFAGDELASKVTVDKYLLRDNDGNILEDSPEKMHRRIAREFARVESKKFKNPLTEDQIFALLDHFRYIVPQGSPMFGIGNNHQTISLSNCFLLDVPLDSYSSILQVDEELVNISKRRGGVGIDLSNLRPAGSVTHNAARQSTGIVTWMERYSNSIREVGQGGRRGALMLTISIHHPDILDFCTIKNDPTKVTGANISVRLSREFLEAVKSGGEYELCFPVDYREQGIEPQISKKVNAQEVWKTIIHSAWLRAEPGLLMWDNVVENTPADCYPRFQSRGTNPCCHSASQSLKVITKAGAKELKDITAQDEVWITDAFHDHWVPTSGYFRVGMADVYRVDFSNGQTFYITREHKLAVVGGYGKIFDLKPLALLNVGDAVCCDGAKLATITAIEFHAHEEVGCINVPDAGFFVTEGGIISGNSEINLSPLDSCRLLLLNLLSYVKDPFTPKAQFDFSLFREHASLAQRLMDDLVDLESEKISGIIAKVQSDPEPEFVKSREIALWEQVKKNNDEGRRTGTGITALGDTLAALGIKYGSEDSIKITEEIYKTLKLGCYQSSVDMAAELGSFIGYSSEAEQNCPFIQRIAEEDPVLYRRMTEVGRRNVSLITTAPAGSVSLLTQTTSGIEPLFMTGYTRRKKINPNDKSARVDFTDQNGDSWQEFTVYHHQIKRWMEIAGETDVSKSPWTGCCADDIDWINRVKLQAAAQRHVCHSISSTINLPENVTEAKVSEIYQTAFESGLKGITVYRKNCRSGVMVEKPTEKPKESAERGDLLIRTVAPKRPKKLAGDVYHFTINGHRFYVIVGLMNAEPYEVFGGINHDGEGDPLLPRSIESGEVIKHARGKYVLKSGEKEYPIMGVYADAAVDSLTRMISTALRHGADISFVVHQLEKSRGEMKSFSKILARTLKKYIPDGTVVAGEKCPSCGAMTLVRENGCKICKSCGVTSCG